jgi:hypothetical protein
VSICHASQEPEVSSPSEANGKDKLGEDSLAQKLGETELMTPAKPDSAEKAASAESSVEEPAKEAPNSGDKRKADVAEVMDDGEEAKKAATASED